MTLLKLSAVSKCKEENQLLKDVSFELPEFRKLGIAGGTGSGKTTLLKIIAGLVQPDKGELLFDNARIPGPDEKLIAGHPGIAYLSQHFELRNNYRVEELLSYANNLTTAEAERLYEICRVDHLLKRKSDQLSGGEKQRIALTRLLVSRPRLLLLDEPFSNLDMFHKDLIKSVIEDISETLEITCILVSHDPLDTLSWADELIIINNGELIQQGSPIEVYRQPVNEYTAALFGSYNLIPSAMIKNFPALNRKMKEGKDLIIRPENVRLLEAGKTGIKGEVVNKLFFGNYYKMEVKTCGLNIFATTQDDRFEKGDLVSVSFKR